LRSERALCLRSRRNKSSWRLSPVAVAIAFPSLSSSHVVVFCRSFVFDLFGNRPKNRQKLRSFPFPLSAIVCRRSGSFSSRSRSRSIQPVAHRQSCLSTDYIQLTTCECVTRGNPSLSHRQSGRRDTLPLNSQSNLNPAS
jgi:hypothetical protein